VAGADVANVAPARRNRSAAPANTSASHASHAGSSKNLIDVCEWVASRTHQPQRTEVMEQLADVLGSHLARGLSPGDIQRQVLNLIDSTRPGHIAHPTISQISNWLARAHPAEDLAAVAVGSASNGRHSSRGDGANGYHGRRQPDLPDPTKNGKYAHRFTVVGDDDPADG
jgi:hypothetical protein